jgi:hypothetical protein
LIVHHGGGLNQEPSTSRRGKRHTSLVINSVHERVIENLSHSAPSLSITPCNILYKELGSPSYLGDAHDGADTQQTGEKKERADPDANLLEHRGVTISELATELNGERAGQGSITIQKVNISVSRFLRRRVADPAFSFPRSL